MWTHDGVDSVTRTTALSEGACILAVPNDIEFSGEEEGARATDDESAAMSCYAAVFGARLRRLSQRR